MEINVLVVEPAKPPYSRQIENTEEAIQKVIGSSSLGTIYTNDSTAIVFNASTLFDFSPPNNRIIRGKRGKVYASLSGIFIVCGETETGHISLSEQQKRVFTNFFNDPSTFPMPRAK